MRLLVTNTRTPQAYAIIRALRPYASRVVATVEGDGLAARLSHAAHSRLVDARCRVPLPIDDWSAGRIAETNSPAEQAFIDEVARVCERERIDIIYPSWDPYVYVLSKNLAFFTERGVTIPVPSFSTVLTALDKHRTIQAARAAGFPCPGSCLYESLEQLENLADRWGYPLVLKPRFTSGGHGMAIIRNKGEAEAALPAILRKHGPPLVQEYIPGGDRDSVQFVIGRDSSLLFAFHKHRTRTFRRTARFGTVSESASPAARLAHTAEFVRQLGWWGAMGIETIRDPRDGVDKLMEVNPRFPRQLWNRTELGINEPLMCVQLARGAQVTPVQEYPEGVLFVSPIEDMQLFALQLTDVLAYTCRRVFGGARTFDPSTAPPGPGAQTRSFARTYASTKRKVWDPYFRYFFQDPIASALWWLQFSTWLAGSWKQVGK
jgi:biotin carboxylase